MGNRFVKYDAEARHIIAKNMTMNLEDQLREAICGKHYSRRTEDSMGRDSACH